VKFAKLIQVIDSHTGGEPTRVVVGGLPHIPGKTVEERISYFREHLEDLRTLLIYEPRGHAAMVAVILTPPISPSSEYSQFFLTPWGVTTMCGHGTIGAAAVAVQTGRVPVQGEITKFNIDTAVGTLRADVRCEGERIKGVTISMVPTFHKDQIEIEVPEIGKIVADITYAGNNFYAQVNTQQKGWTAPPKLVPENARQLIDAALRIRETINRVASFDHPELPWVHGVSAVDMYGPPLQSNVNLRDVHVFGAKGVIDRSACGTGTAGMMTMLHARGKLKKGEVYAQEGILGTTLQGRVIGETRVGDHSSVLTEITGQPFITGLSQIIVDEDDPLKKGFLL
jgi:proline racemase